jgi:aromatic-amino-acid transaminase
VVETYPMFEADHFNLKGFIDQSEKVVAKQNKLITIINDPCQNPTGYSMSHGEWEAVIAYFNELAIRNVPVILLYDIAYLDYADETYEESRDRFALLNQLKGNTLVVVTFSGSKTYSIYGLRLGAQIALSKDLGVIAEFERVSLYSARARWSCPPKSGINLVNKIMSDDGLETQFKKELIVSRKLLKSRSDMFLKEANEVGLPMFPYRGGYFVTLPHPNPKQAFEDLIKAEIYSIPLSKGIRIAVCALPLAHIKGLALKIKQTIY